MNIKSERGQAEIAIVLILAVIAIAAVFGMMAANQPGMRARTESHRRSSRGSHWPNETRRKPYSFQCWG